GKSSLAQIGGRDSGHCFHLLHLGHVVPEHVLDAHFQGGGGGRAAGAGAAHVQEDRSVLETLVDDVAAVLGHGGANARVDQFLDCGNDLGVKTAVTHFVV